MVPNEMAESLANDAFRRGYQEGFADGIKHLSVATEDFVKEVGANLIKTVTSVTGNKEGVK